MLVFLTGFMGCGKSTVGRLLADQLGIPFLDSDEEIERLTGVSVRTIFEKRGEAAFRELEKLFVHHLNAGQDAVVSLGGGLPCYHNLMDHLTKTGRVVYLKTSAESLVNRLENEREKRPLLKEADEFREFVANKLQEREPVYQQAHYSVSTDGKSPETITREIMVLFR